MKIDSFIEKNNLRLDNKEYKLCKQSEEIMTRSLDVSHSEKHVYELLRSLDKFISTKDFQEKKSNVDLRVLFLAVCWHDVWRAGRDFRNKASIFWNTFWDGAGSSLEFSRFAKRERLTKEIIFPVKYAIKKHSFFQFIPAKTEEAKILSDLDDMEMFNLERLKELKNNFFYKRKLSYNNLKVAKFSLEFFLKLGRKRELYHDRFRRLFAKRGDEFFKEAGKILKEYEFILKKKGGK